MAETVTAFAEVYAATCYQDFSPHHPPLRHFPAAQAYLLSTGSWNTQTTGTSLHKSKW